MDRERDTQNNLATNPAQGYFAMWNVVSESVANLDLGASGPIILPDLADASGNVKHLAAGAGTDGNIYIVDRDSMSKFNSSRNNIWQKLDGALSQFARSTGAYFNGRLCLADVLFGVGVKFTVPTVADGKVFVSCKTGVGVFGLLH